MSKTCTIKLELCNDVVVCDFSSSYLEALEQDIMTSWESYSSANEAKSMLRSLRTPITLFSCFMLFYMLSGINDNYVTNPERSITRLSSGYLSSCYLSAIEKNMCGSNL